LFGTIFTENTVEGRRREEEEGGGLSGAREVVRAVLTEHPRLNMGIHGVCVLVIVHIGDVAVRLNDFGVGLRVCYVVTIYLSARPTDE
jgi:hypothetical protein